MLRALIFDFDGTILDTEMPTFIAWQQTYAKYGQVLTLEEYSAVIGSDYHKFDPRRTLEERSGQRFDWHTLDTERRSHCYRIIEQQESLPGVRRLLLEAKARGIRCGVASSSPTDWVQGHLERLGLLSHFSSISCADNGCPPKPAPDVYLRALKLLNISPDEALAIEDSPNGLLAAQSAGIRCIIVPNQLTRLLPFPAKEQLLSGLGSVSLENLTGLSAILPQ